MSETAPLTQDQLNVLMARVAQKQNKKSLVKDLVPPKPASNDDASTDNADANGLKNIATSENQPSVSGADPTGFELASAIGLELVKDQHGALRVKHTAGNRLRFPLIDSADVQDLVTAHWLQNHGVKGLKTGVETAMTKLRIAAKASTKTVRTMVRVGSRVNPDGHRQYLLDLGRDDGQMVVVDHKAWVLEKNTTEAFLQPDGECALPRSFDSPKAAYEYIERLFTKAGIPESLRLLVCVAVVCMLRDDMAYIILECIGAAGAGKTTFVNMLVQTIDPSGSGRLVNTSFSTRDIAAVSSKHQLLVFDNASSLRREDQDLACQIPYGFTFAERELYTNHGVASVTIHCPIFITSINPAITQTDLQTRRLLIPFAARQRYAQDVKPTEEDRGMLLGAFLTLLVAGLAQQMLEPITESRHRMAEYASFGEAISRALGNEAGYFSDLYAAAKQSAARDYANGDPTAFAIDKFLRGQEKHAVLADSPPKQTQIRKDRGFIIRKPNGRYLAGYTPKGLRLGANSINGALPYDERIAKSSGYTFPETDRAMTGAMNRLISSVLPDLGFKAAESRLGSEKNKETLYLFEWEGSNA